MKGEIAVRYTIRHFDLPLFTFEANMDSADTGLHIIKVYEENRSFLPLNLTVSEDGVECWLRHRAIPKNRAYVDALLSKVGLSLNELRAVFAMAKEDAPSILLLEDLNLYVESNSPYAPEWACLQACIDDAKDTDLFVIATTNDTRYMPPSLLRPGRFDYVIYLQPPIGENAENIVSYYLRDKDLAEDKKLQKYSP